MRLNKYIAASGICSRRKADELIFQGRVSVNGKASLTPGVDVIDGDDVKLDGKSLAGPKKHVYYALNKPIGYMVSSAGRGLLAEDLLKDLPMRVFPIGRLDVNTSGLLLFTNDGDFANFLMSPSSGIKKTYVARLNGRISEKSLELLRKGVDIGGYVTKPAAAEVLKNEPGSSIIEISVSEGKNRQVRRMAEAVGLRVIELKRISEGPVKIGRLRSGSYRKLSFSEMAEFKALMKEKKE